MAFFLDDDEKKQGDLKTASGGQSNLTGGSGGGAGSGTGGVAKAPTGSGFTNVKSYLDAGGTGSGQKMAGEVVGGLSSKADESRAGIDESYNKQTADFNKNTTQPMATDNTYFSDPSTIDKDDFSKYYNQDIDPSDYSFSQDDFAGESGNWQQKADAAGSYGGTQALLGEQYGGGGKNYSSGMKGLDSFLVRSGGGDKFQSDVKDLQSGVDDYATQRGVDFAGNVAQRDQSVQQAQDNFRSLYGKNLTDAGKGMSSYYSGGPGQYTSKGDYERIGGEREAKYNALQGLIDGNLSNLDWGSNFDAIRKMNPVETKAVQKIGTSDPVVEDAPSKAAKVAQEAAIKEIPSVSKSTFDGVRVRPERLSRQIQRGIGDSISKPTDYVNSRIPGGTKAATKVGEAIRKNIFGFGS